MPEQSLATVLDAIKGSLSVCRWHVDRPPPFAFVTADQQVQPFGRSLAPKHAHSHPFNLRVDDIPGAKPKQHCFGTSPRLTNPLEPRYQLPHSDYVQPAPPVPRFIRNAHDNSDIPGAQVSYLSSSACVSTAWNVVTSTLLLLIPANTVEWTVPMLVAHIGQSTADSNTKASAAPMSPNTIIQ